MATGPSFFDHKAYHIISYGTFLGTTFFQSFIAGPVAFKTLPRALFGRLQESTFPIFFSLQTALSAALLFTFPGEPATRIGQGAYRVHSRPYGAFDERNLWSVGVPMLVMLVSSAANLAWLGPVTTRTMKQRHHQETKDGKKSYDAGPHSPEMTALNKRFAILHGVSSLLNLAGYAASMYYGFVLGARL